MSDRKVIPLQPQFFLLELHSERFMDFIHALKYSGFVVSNTMVTNRFRIEDDPRAEAQQPTA